MTCRKKYFTNSHSIGFRINQIYADLGVGPWTFPYPFIPIAWCDGNRPPRDIKIASVAAQALYRLNMEQFSQQMAAANCNPGTLQGAVTYTETTLNPGYANYLNDYLGDATIGGGGSFVPGSGVGELNSQAFLTMLGLISSFWNEENTIATTTQWRDLLQFIGRLEKQSDLRLWLPPGVYDVDNATAPPALGTLIADLVNFPDGISLLVIELKSIE